MNNNTAAVYLDKIQRLQKNTSLPQEILCFLEHILSLPEASLRKKVQYEYDALQHASGKSILTRQGLYPYAKLGKAEEALQLVLNVEFPQTVQEKEFVKSFALVKKNMAQDSKLAKKLLHAYLHEEEAFYQEQAQVSSEYAFMCYFLAYFAFMPFFVYTRSQIEEAAKVTYDEEVWAHGHCPYCGGAPQLSYLKEKEGKRMHACSVCLALYRAPRIACPYCLENKQEKLKYFTADAVKDAQVCVCESCTSYIKICDAREYEKFTPLPYVDDFSTVLLDIMANQQGYEGGVLSLWLR